MFSTHVQGTNVGSNDCITCGTNCEPMSTKQKQILHENFGMNLSGQVSLLFVRFCVSQSHTKVHAYIFLYSFLIFFLSFADNRWYM
jgi:hypothetical protein